MQPKRIFSREPPARIRATRALGAGAQAVLANLRNSTSGFAHAQGLSILHIKVCQFCTRSRFLRTASCNTPAAVNSKRTRPPAPALAPRPAMRLPSTGVCAQGFYGTTCDQACVNSVLVVDDSARLNSCIQGCQRGFGAAPGTTDCQACGGDWVSGPVAGCFSGFRGRGHAWVCCMCG